MQTLRLSLRALRHPLTLSSIGLLIINDHLLKVVAPSWLTGKLSDFAGLFFFPFLLAAFLALPLERLKPRQVMTLACFVSSGWFISIKTLPAANALTTQLLTWLLGVQSNIILDPTDLAALPMLGLAGWLWVHLEQTPVLEKSDWGAYLALGLSAWATMATSACPPEFSISRLSASGEIVYARGDGYGRPVIYASKDAGRTWFNPSPKEIPGNVISDMQFDPILPVTACNPDHEQQCYRIDGQDFVEYSGDGGEVWSDVWQIPYGRQRFMERYRLRPLSCKSGNEMNTKPLDIIFVKQGSEYVPIMAMGNEGVLAFAANSVWQRYSVEQAEPTPFSEDHPIGLLVDLMPESTVIISIALLSLISTYWRASSILHNGLAADMQASWLTRGAWISIASTTTATIGLAIAFALSRQFRLAWDTALYRTSLLIIVLAGRGFWITIAVVLAAVIVIVIGWQRLFSQAKARKYVWRSLWTSLLVMLALILVPEMIVILWLYGLIPFYEVALWLALLAIIVIFRVGLRSISYSGYLSSVPLPRKEQE